ncbi:MAG: UDP-glucose/GDP-mannose dehydrogenase family protein [Bdellovibrionales bacterium]|nr:UDP-glucose/GDP-mannose dehydrogenase family protein [Bdellovibrionales bacterium]MCB0332435.1 UDP-glucose/GDP-mannose dehydrogenase family protein [Bdellovibrionales bacterium]
MNIAVIGTGYVGLVAGACFADSGNDVICVDKDESKVASLRDGVIPIYEPGLHDIVLRNTKNGRLQFTTSLQEGVQASTVIFIAVGTPQDEDGSADLSHVLAVAEGIGKYMNGPKVIVDKSTVPVGTAARVTETIAKHTDYDFEVVSNPEFLKEGAAIDDFMKPDRVVVGVPSEKSAKVMRDLYKPFVRTNNPILVMDVPSAEMTKYASNAMLATRISFMNEMAALCEKAGADIDQVRIGMGTDSRIGMSFLFPGIGYGGSCFPKDVQALIRTAHELGAPFQIGESVEAVNARQKHSLVTKIVDFYGGEASLQGKTFAVWGLAFKPRTDDVREAPALVVCEELVRMGAHIQAYDPEAMGTFEERFGENDALTYCKTNYEALRGADALVICTEWNDFRHPNFSKIEELMDGDVIFDGRNLFSLEEMHDTPFSYFSIGRPAVRKA